MNIVGWHFSFIARGSLFHHSLPPFSPIPLAKSRCVARANNVRLRTRVVAIGPWAFGIGMVMERRQSCHANAILSCINVRVACSFSATHSHPPTQWLLWLRLWFWLWLCPSYKQTKNENERNEEKNASKAKSTGFLFSSFYELWMWTRTT